MQINCIDFTRLSEAKSSCEGSLTIAMAQKGTEGAEARYLAQAKNTRTKTLWYFSTPFFFIKLQWDWDWDKGLSLRPPRLHLLITRQC